MHLISSRVTVSEVQLLCVSHFCQTVGPPQSHAFKAVLSSMRSAKAFRVCAHTRVVDVEVVLLVVLVLLLLVVLLPLLVVEVFVLVVFVLVVTGHVSQAQLFALVCP